MTRVQLMDATAGSYRALLKCLEELERPSGQTELEIGTALAKEQFAAADGPTPPPDAAGVTPKPLRRITRELTRFLGPIAPM